MSNALTKLLANKDWCGPASHFKPTSEVVQTEVLRQIVAPEYERMELALRSIMDAHKFNVATLRANEVHEICYRALDLDPEPAGIARPDPQLIVSEGLTWEVWSRNERSTTLGGRHFFAVRCKPTTRWTIIEYDGPAGTSGRKEIARRKTRWFSSLGLSAEVQLFYRAQERKA